MSGTLIEMRKNTQGQLIINNGPERGNWFQTPYATTIYRSISQTSLGFAADLSMKEMNLLRAEAHSLT